MTQTPRPGDFGVVRTGGLVGKLIRLGTRSQVNHAFVVVGENRIIEAQSRGAQLSPLSKYDGHVVAYSQFTRQDEQRKVVLAAYALLRTPYGFLDILALGLVSLGVKWEWLTGRVQRENRLICSQLVDRAFTAAGVNLYDDGRPDGSVTPGDLLMLLATDAAPARTVTDRTGYKEQA